MTTAATASTASSDPLVLLRDADGVVTLTLNRPAQFNALSSALLTELQDALDGIAENHSVRVVVIAGAGPAFCAGHDLKEMRASRDPGVIEDLFKRCSRMMMTLVEIPQPVIARVHGIATAAGCQLVAGCDLAVASTEARFATSGVNLGLFCSTPGVALGRDMPRKQAMEMLLTGDFIDAQTALKQGLVNRVAPPAQLDSEVMKLAAAIKGKSRAAVSLGKRTFYKQLEMNMEQAYQYANQVMASNMMDDDAAEGIDAFIQKRPPKWREAD
ncbi:MAG TPA: enoyl-CoA hydratase [Burkholderiales bacterium]|nr:enoyl-CoA hydratase [Burkholderiales bacterium]